MIDEDLFQRVLEEDRQKDELDRKPVSKENWTPFILLLLIYLLAVLFA